MHDKNGLLHVHTGFYVHRYSQYMSSVFLFVGEGQEWAVGHQHIFP